MELLNSVYIHSLVSIHLQTTVYKADLCWLQLLTNNLFPGNKLSDLHQNELQNGQLCCASTRNIASRNEQHFR